MKTEYNKILELIEHADNVNLFTTKFETHLSLATYLDSKWLSSNNSFISLTFSKKGGNIVVETFSNIKGIDNFQVTWEEYSNIINNAFFQMLKRKKLV